MFARTIPQFWLWNLCPPPMMNTISSGWDLLLISVDALADSVAISLAPPCLDGVVFVFPSPLPSRPSSVVDLPPVWQDLLFVPLLSVWQDLSSVLFSAMQATAA
jgi:hypothetical protein